MKIKSSIISGVLEIETDAETVSFPYRVNISEATDKIVSLSNNIENGTSETIGESFVKLLGVIFGDETAEKLVGFYSQDFTAMVADMMPFITDEIYPRIKAQKDKALNALKVRKF